MIDFVCPVMVTLLFAIVQFMHLNNKVGAYSWASTEIWPCELFWSINVFHVSVPTTSYGVQVLPLSVSLSLL